MTIRELCKNYDNCFVCPFSWACPFNSYKNDPLETLNKESDLKVTKSIIEVAEILTGSNKNGNQNKENL